ncbi:hypothetical protein G9A89_015777 [Geosiphon pyriformis]|nr:hypothetical protein G9A89_015777 [Geosiphon pyriformis]
MMRVIFCSSAGGSMCIESIYSRSLLYKKSRNPSAPGGVVDLLAGLVPITVLQTGNLEHKVSWSSEVEGKNASVSGVSDLENMTNMVAEEMSYVGSSGSEADDMSPKFQDSNQLPNIMSHGLEKRSFKPVKLFALDVELAAMSGKTNDDKALFTSEFSMKKAKELTICKKILINDNLRKEVIIKEISVNLFKSAIESVFSKFGQVILIRIQLIGLWQKALVKFKSSDVASLDQHQALVYTLPVGTMAHDFSVLVEAFGGKTYFIGHRCTVICFEDKASMLAAVGSVPVFKGVSLHWAGLSLACYAKCKQFGHVSEMYSVSGNSGVCEKWVVTDYNWVCLANIYKKKQMPIICPVFFVADGSSFLLSSSSLLGTGLSSGTKFSIGAWSSSTSADPHDVSGIVRKLSFVELVSLLPVSYKLLLAVFTPLAPEVNSDMVLDDILTTKMGGLESKIMSLEALISSVLIKLDYLCSGSGSLLPFSSQ